MQLLHLLLRQLRWRPASGPFRGRRPLALPPRGRLLLPLPPLVLRLLLVLVRPLLLSRPGVHRRRCRRGQLLRLLQPHTLLLDVRRLHRKRGLLLLLLSVLGLLPVLPLLHAAPASPAPLLRLLAPAFGPFPLRLLLLMAVPMVLVPVLLLPMLLLLPLLPLLPVLLLAVLPAAAVAAAAARLALRTLVHMENWVDVPPLEALIRVDRGCGCDWSALHQDWTNGGDSNQ